MPCLRPQLDLTRVQPGRHDDLVGAYCMTQARMRAAAIDIAKRGLL